MFRSASTISPAQGELLLRQWHHLSVCGFTFDPNFTEHYRAEFHLTSWWREVVQRQRTNGSNFGSRSLSLKLPERVLTLLCSPTDLLASEFSSICCPEVKVCSAEETTQLQTEILFPICCSCKPKHCANEVTAYFYWHSVVETNTKQHVRIFKTPLNSSGSSSYISSPELHLWVFNWNVPLGGSQEPRCVFD